MGYARRFRRHAHRIARAPRSAWRRSATLIPGGHYRDAGILNPPGQWVVASHDAPYEEEDARFWDWVAVTLIATSVGLVIFGIVALA